MKLKLNALIVNLLAYFFVWNRIIFRCKEMRKEQNKEGEKDAFILLMDFLSEYFCGFRLVIPHGNVSGF